MELNVHHQVLLSVFGLAILFGAVANKTHFCTLGAVSDWVNIGDTGRMRAWLFAMAVALAGVLAMEAGGYAQLGGTTYPPYRTPIFSWLRYLVGGFAFGVGMTLASGCGSKTLIRAGSGNLKSVVVLVTASVCAYLMLWTDLYAAVFNPWLTAGAFDLGQYGIRSQSLGDVIASVAGGDGRLVGSIAGWGMVSILTGFAFASRDFRGSFDNVIGGLVVGLVIAAGWYITAGPLGAEWKDFAEMSTVPPSRVEVQSFTFIGPMGDALRYLMSPANGELINFGIVALTGVLSGSFAYAVIARGFRIEWFANGPDFARHVVGGALLGVGGIVAMGCTIGQAITGVSTLAMGSFLTFGAIVTGSVATMKIHYWLMMREDA